MQYKKYVRMICAAAQDGRGVIAHEGSSVTHLVAKDVECFHGFCLGDVRLAQDLSQELVRLRRVNGRVVAR